MIESRKDMLSCTDTVELIRYCKEAAEENASMNDAKWASRYDGRAIADTYLDGNVLWVKGGDEANVITYCIDTWLKTKGREEKYGARGDLPMEVYGVDGHQIRLLLVSSMGVYTDVLLEGAIPSFYEWVAVRTSIDPTNITAFPVGAQHSRRGSTAMRCPCGSGAGEVLFYGALPPAEIRDLICGNF